MGPGTLHPNSPVVYVCLWDVPASSWRSSGASLTSLPTTLEDPAQCLWNAPNIRQSAPGLSALILATQEIAHVNHALGACSYPSWSFKTLRKQLDHQELKDNLKSKKKDCKCMNTKTSVTLPYVKCVSDPQSWVLCCHGLAISIQHNLTLKRILWTIDPYCPLKSVQDKPNWPNVIIVILVILVIVILLYYFLW